MRLYAVSSIVGQEAKSIKGKMSSVPKIEGTISSKERCETFKDEHLALGHHVSPIKKWRRSSKTHRKSRSGKRKAETA